MPMLNTLRQPPPQAPSPAPQATSAPPVDSGPYIERSNRRLPWESSASGADGNVAPPPTTPPPAPPPRATATYTVWSGSGGSDGDKGESSRD
jgi:hypothetical protein